MPAITDTIYVRNMVCQCCVRVICEEMTKAGVGVLAAELGKLMISYDDQSIDREGIRLVLKRNGFELVTDRESIIVEQIKQAVIELVHYANNVNSIIRKSDYIVERIGISYQTISKLFSKHERITLEKFIILHKIEKIKELLMCNEYTLSEIAYMMDYSSVQHLSMAFRKNAGVTVSEFKAKPEKYNQPLDHLD